jgi:ubiquinone/menaquinone biosynthesis C-methylase UbiE
MQYSLKTYWNERYAKDNEPFEWLQSYTTLKEYLEKYVPKQGKILHLGCGSSELGIEMYKGGWTDIINIDFSNLLIDSLKKRYSNNVGLMFTEMNAEEMSFPKGVFDTVIDKACIDSVLCSDGAARRAEKIIKNINKVLKPEGVFLMVSIAKSDIRKRFLEKQEYNWQIVVESIPKPTLSTLPIEEDKNHYLYICKKNLVSLFPVVNE